MISGLVKNMLNRWLCLCALVTLWAILSNILIPPISAAPPTTPNHHEEILKNERSGTIQTRPIRLPNTTYPLRYHLHVVTQIHKQIFDYTGNATLEILVKESTNEIVLHAKRLTDFVITVNEINSGDLLEDIIYLYDNERSLLVIQPRDGYQAFEAGQIYRLEILYKGTMSNNTIGLYWLTYNDENDKSVYLAATQFEPTGARYAFPCYDEPSFKSSFIISITHGSNYSAISNMPTDGQPMDSTDNETVTTTFKETPPMSTYLVAFIISNFENISVEYRNVLQRVFTAPNALNKGHAALENAVRTVAALEDYLGIPYGLSKLDHIALQKNYGVAMENWGLITYREGSLPNSNEPDAHRKFKDLLTQNHEIAHQWFGDLVSPEWWTYAWMNEGFAVYFSYLITDIIYPDYKAMEDFFTDVIERAYSNIMTRPMSYYIEKESDIPMIFDYITYQRAACVIRMFHHAFKRHVFIEGLRKFLKKYRYRAANENQLFAELQAAIHDDMLATMNGAVNPLWINSVDHIMTSWTHSEQIPIVLVSINHERNTVTIRQTPKDPKSKELWWIPLNFVTKSQIDFENTQADIFMPPVREMTVSLEELGIEMKPHDWLIVNKQMTGFYHVLYDDTNLMAIAKQLQSNHSVIHHLNRAAIFQDLCLLLENNEIKSIDVIFELFKYLQNEKNAIPWNYAPDVMGLFGSNLYYTHSDALFKDFIRTLVAPVFEEMFPRITTNISTGISPRQRVLEIACHVDLPKCLEFTRERAHSILFEKVPLGLLSENYGMHDLILCMGLKYINDSEFSAIMDLLNRTKDADVRQDLIYSLRCTKSHSHLRQYLTFLINESANTQITYDENSMVYLFYLYISNLEARPVVWAYIEKNYKDLCKSLRFIENFNRIAEYVPKSYHEQFLLLHQKIDNELKSFGKNNDFHKNSLLDINSDRIGKKVQHNEIFLTDFEQDIYDWLSREILNNSSEFVS